MENNIYSIDEWVASTNYYKNKIIISAGVYYYAASNHISSSSLSTDITSGLWGGIITDGNQIKPHFIWVPGYNHSTAIRPKVKTVQFGDSYKQIIRDGINNILPEIDLEFESDLSECTAILHFLETRGGAESFVFLPPAPRGTLGRFICKEWQDTQISYNNYKIQCKFERSTT